ncbi:MAG: MucR family transcriptional regulator [Novosphingobium sp.]|jgi:predicted transcriptional regulator
MENETLVTLTADIVSAHVSNNSVQLEAIPGLIQSVYHALATVDAPAPAAEEERKSAVSVRASVKLDVVTCLECGFKGKMLKRHFMTEHGLTPQDYKARWQLASDHPLVAPNYASQRAELAKAIGLGRMPAHPRGLTLGLAAQRWDWLHPRQAPGALG